MTAKKPRLELRVGKSLGGEFRRLALLHLEFSLERIRGRNLSVDEVHDTRTSIKKIRTMIDLISPSLKVNARRLALEPLREAGRRLSPLRDSDVALGTLEGLIQAHALEHMDLDSIRNGLQDAARQRRLNAKKKVSQFRELLKTSRHSVADWPTDSIKGSAIRLMVRRIYRKARSRLERCQTDHDEVAFHSFRKFVKHLYYSLRITLPYWPEALVKERIGRLRVLGELAGRERDFCLLRGALTKGPGKPSSELLISLLAREIPVLRKSTLREASLFFDTKPKSFVESLDL
jgi:CHAD domain-containing protein